jgi:hypothetical protein
VVFELTTSLEPPLSTGVPAVYLLVAKEVN